MTIPLAIIPCAGFGTRMNVSPNESKELLIDPNTYNDPLIKYSLDLCNKYNIDPLLIIRPEKLDLITYCNDNNINYILHTPIGEWASTVLASEKYWRTDNLLLLPDTRFSPENILLDIKHSLEFQPSVVFALHKVDDISKWGNVTPFTYCEKPDRMIPGWAWGIIGFKKWYGKELFLNMSEKGKIHSSAEHTNFLFLDSFQDITRSGKLDVY